MKKGKYHTIDQIYSKWRNTNKLAMEFNDVFVNVTHFWPSGANDVLRFG